MDEKGHPEKAIEKPFARSLHKKGCPEKATLRLVSLDEKGHP